MIFTLLVSGQIGCFNDPFDPWLGPRLPYQGASSYLSGRYDIFEAEKRALLGYQPCSPETLKKLVDAPAREVRFLVALNSGADAGILKTLSVDHEAAVRQAVALNRNTPQAVLLQLSRDRNNNVRWAVTHRPDWPH